ncbi:phosphatase PAP2 family protein [Massilia endophytica]|uniref:phosphatase PAP2 family protein n=1 Tax=Massilia endophytica TaxID=2899220 RepID=UPI001E60A187|nr:phosphatase PAP2 family protein [Massilia endophytica]UGQ48848.1 phosphatase PAP2 family protein [Massilia endophytica]
MEHLNYTLFTLINAPADPSQSMLWLAKLFGIYAIYAVPALIAVGWLRGSDERRKAMLMATAAAVVGLCISNAIGQLWPHPRPFVISLGHTLMHHDADASFPSDHLTLLWSVAFALTIRNPGSMANIALVLLGFPVAWARIYLGVHYPLDMVGAALVASASAALTASCAPWFLPTVFQLATRVHRHLFARLIRSGWVQP